jgi:raffinose/stachyose/melibiose transport system permease protein
MKKKSKGNIIVKVLLIAFALSAIYPIVWMMINSLKTAQEVIANPIGLPDVLRFSNYSEAVQAFDFFRYLLNSGIYTVGTIGVTVICASLFAYATARIEFRFNDLVMKYIQLGLVVPMAIIILSLYILLGDINLKNTYMGTILVYTASALPMSVLILYAFMRSLPFELEEAAYIDGCGAFKAFYKIILPMVKSALSTVVIICFMNYSWNEYFTAFITIDDIKMRSIPVAIGYFSTSRGTEWGLLCAALVVTSIPAIIIYLIGSEKIEEALTVGSAMK